MTSSLGSVVFASNMMKANFGDSWGGTNLSGFSGLPGGGRDYGTGLFYVAGFFGYWWSSSPSDSGAWSRKLFFNDESVDRLTSNLQLGFSVRCVRGC